MSNVFKLEDFKASPFPGKHRSLTAEERRGGKFRVTKPRGAPPDITLTDDQQHALEGMLWFESGGSEKFFVLQGFAGTGKTTVLQHYLRACKGTAVLSAPTNKAVRVLREMAGAHGIEVPCCTVHKLLGMRIAKDAEEKYCVTRRGSETIAEFDVLIVDECSMVGNREVQNTPGLYDQLMRQVGRWGIKVIFVGDPGQLPPVKEGKLSPSFEAGPGAFLSKVVRQALDNPIIRLATYFRGKMDGEDPPPPELEDDGFNGVYATGDRHEFQDLIIEAYLDEPDHPTKYKALAFRNAVVDAINDGVRRELHGADAEKYIVGERYVATQPVIEWAEGDIPIIQAATDEDAVLVDIEETRLEDLPQYRALLLRMSGLDGDFPAIVPHPDDEERWQDDLANLEKLAKKKRGRVSWRDFWALHDAFAHFKPHYAMTCHRSQGSTYENVFVDVPDVLSNPSGFWEAIRCLYTACTRASKMLYLYEGK